MDWRKVAFFFFAAHSFTANASAYDAQIEPPVANVVNATKLRELLRIELAGLEVDECSFRVEPQNVVVVRVSSGGVARERVVEVDDLKEGGERTLALIAHTLAASPPTVAPAPAPIPPAVEAKVPQPAPPPAEPAKPTDWRVRPLFGVEVTSTFSGGPPVGGVSAGLLVHESKSRFGVSFDVGYQFAQREDALGSLSLNGARLSATPYYRLGPRERTLAVDVGPRLTAAYIWLNGDASANVSSRNISDAIAQLSITSTLWIFMRGPMALFIGGECGGYLKGVRVRSGGSDIASFDGLYLGARGGVSF